MTSRGKQNPHGGGRIVPLEHFQESGNRFSDKKFGKNKELERGFDSIKTRSALDTLRVWDIAVRLFHWSLVLLVAAAAYTGFLGPEWQLGMHVLAGYGIGLLILFRVIWGFAGSRYARFASFLFSPRELASHIQGILRGKSERYIGHNPAGALMVFALLIVLAALTVSGLIVLGGQENQGMLAAFSSYKSGQIARNIHELLGFLLLAMIGAHLAGVVLESALSRENLVRAMITGRKHAKTGRAADLADESRVVWRAPVIFALISLIAGLTYWVLANRPASGFTVMKRRAVWASECGDCHYAYHPSLLPRSSWRRIMAGLDEHFGEDASLDEETAARITSFLTTYASEEWDSEAANELRKTDAQKPLEITATPYWKQRHARIDPEIFRRKMIGSKANCIACHKDAANGRFADEEITIPDKHKPNNKGEKK